jgi:hypothetical protein
MEGCDIPRPFIGLLYPIGGCVAILSEYPFEFDGWEFGGGIAFCENPFWKMGA